MYLRRFMGNNVEEEFTDCQHYVIVKHADENYIPINVGTYTFQYENEEYELTIKHAINKKSSSGFVTKYYFDQNNNICISGTIIDSNGKYYAFIPTNYVISLEFSSNIQYIDYGSTSNSLLEKLVLPNDLIKCEIYADIDTIDILNITENVKYFVISTCNTINTIKYNAIDCEYFYLYVNNVEKCVISNSIKSMPRGNLNYLYNITNKYTFSTFYSINQLYPYSLTESRNDSDENDMAILHQSACENNKTLQHIYDSKIIPYNCYNGCNIALTDPKNRKDITYIFKGNKFINSEIISVAYFWYLCYAYELYNFDLYAGARKPIKIIRNLILDNNFNKNNIFISDSITYISIEDTSSYTKKLEISACDNKIVNTNKVYDETEILYIGNNIDISGIKTKRMIIPINVNVIGHFDENLETIKFYSATQLPEDIFIWANNLTSIEGYLNTYINFSKTAFYKNLPVDEYGCIYYNNCLIGYDKTQNQHIIEGSNYLDVVINENCTRILIPFSNFNDTNVFIPANVNIIYPSTHVTANITIDENNYYYDVINNHIITNASRSDGKYILTVYDKFSSLNNIVPTDYLYTIEDLEIELKGNINNVIFNGTVITTGDTTFTNCSINKLIPRSGNIVINKDDGSTTTINRLEVDTYSNNQINITGNYKIYNTVLSEPAETLNLNTNDIKIAPLKDNNKLDLYNTNYGEVYVHIHSSSGKTILLNNGVHKLTIEDRIGYNNYTDKTYLDIYYDGTLEELLKLNVSIIGGNTYKVYGKLVHRSRFIFGFYYKNDENNYKYVNNNTLNYLSNYTQISNRFIFHSIGRNDDYYNHTIIVIPNSIKILNLNIVSEQYIDLRNLSDDANVSINFYYNFLKNYVSCVHHIYLNSNTFKILSKSYNSGTVTGSICLYYDGYKSDLINDLCNTEFGKKLMQTCCLHEISQVSISSSATDYNMFTAYCYDGKLEL